MASRAKGTLVVVAAVMAASGVMAGATGIGGALIFNPYLLALKVHPQAGFLLVPSVGAVYTLDAAQMAQVMAHTR